MPISPSGSVRVRFGEPQLLQNFMSKLASADILFSIVREPFE